ncbi:siroheme synthase [Malaciobacter mytili]|uniref:precorrin-2 dehydrogenase/sirohydrochlorin ferrochelatase family protein n=1 Tax=Malaciobacter mytili TaxID=603050 RepID=UPI00100B86CE|nr:bifunctional precorrin-2 dehydrogenase/sirohydrochlorin ferrochelatase [Malaciobacter mytili]RXI43444.1 siroheme synthase [Malaciobacter mytili]
MAYFPAFIRFEKKRVLIIGGGIIAQEKLVHLLEFTSDITLLSKDFTKNILDLITLNSLNYIKKEYEIGDIKGYDIIIVAIDDISLQEKIYIETREFNCLCNCVDLPNCCDFIFPAYIKKGDLTIAISTSGTSPAFAKNLRIYLEKIIPNNVNEFLKKMKEYRKTMPKGKDRMKFLDKQAKEYIEKWNKNEI